jgi:chemotaxis protein histidine kinase CheA
MTFRRRKGKEMHTNRILNDFVSSYIHESIQDIKDVLLLLENLPSDISIASTLPSTTQIIEDMTDFDEYKHVVALLCAIEGVLNRVRVAELRPKASLIALLLICCGHVSTMVSQLANRDEIYRGHLNRSHGLIRQLSAYHGSKVEYATAA